MTTTQPLTLTSKNRDDILKPSPRVRVGLLGPLGENEKVCLDPRWIEPFSEREIEVIRIPVGSKNIPEILEHLDGLVLPGGDSNIHPFFYTGFYADFDNQDIQRDNYAFDLIKEAYRIDLPTLGICRGMQEMIVAFEGHLQTLDKGEYDHAQGYKAPFVNGYRCRKTMDNPAHPFLVQSKGILSKIYNEQTLQKNIEKLESNGFYRDGKIWVNSTHHEGTTLELWAGSKKLRETFIIEALAPDDVVEAISAIGKRFFVGLQPHFELEGVLRDMLFDNPQHGFVKHILDRHNEKIGHLKAALGPGFALLKR